MVQRQRKQPVCPLEVRLPPGRSGDLRDCRGSGLPFRDPASRMILPAISPQSDQRVVMRSERPRGGSSAECRQASDVIVDKKERLLSARPFDQVQRCPGRLLHVGLSLRHDRADISRQALRGRRAMPVRFSASIHQTP